MALSEQTVLSNSFWAAHISSPPYDAFRRRSSTVLLEDIATVEVAVLDAVVAV
jgi:hypothetical protein